jgi:DNA replication protein DnaC
VRERISDLIVPPGITGKALSSVKTADDWGPEPLIAEQQRDLLEIIEDRYNAGSLIITSQVPVDRWHDIVGNPTLADAILDRFIHNAHDVTPVSHPAVTRVRA